MGGRTSQTKTVDYLDLSLHLPPSIQPYIESCFTDFLENHLHIVISPRIKGDELLINSTDFIAFLGYVDSSRMSEFERHHFLQQAKRQMEQLLLKSLSRDYQHHYQWCLAALNNFSLGRYLSAES